MPSAIAAAGYVLLAAAVAASGCSSEQQAQGGAGAGAGSSSAGVGGGGGGDGGSSLHDLGIAFPQGESIGPINEGFIGGPCTQDQDCAYAGGFCLTEEQGFPGGMCSLDCGGFCPDQEGMVTTFCPNPEALSTTADEGLCTVRCDYGQSPTGCREGYQCQQLARYGNPASQIFACVPGTDNPHVLSDCEQELLARDIAFSPAVDPMDSPDGFPELICTIENPVWVEPYFNGVAFHPGAVSQSPTSIFNACAHTLAMDDSAQVLADAGVTALVHYGVYACRTISGTSTLSEHAFGNAIDIAGVQVGDDGPYYSVLGDWEIDQPDPMTPGGTLLYNFAQTIYDEYIYNIILTPNYNAAHADHLHCDLTPGSHFLD